MSGKARRREDVERVAAIIRQSGALERAGKQFEMMSETIEAGAQFGLVAKNPIGEPILATPAWADDLLIVRGAKHLFAIAEKP